MMCVICEVEVRGEVTYSPMTERLLLHLILSVVFAANVLRTVDKKDTTV